MSIDTYPRDTRYIEALADAHKLQQQLGIGSVTVTETMVDVDSDAEVHRFTATYAGGPWDAALTATAAGEEVTP
ncbi:hypothetical protein L5G28_07665 [Gordonia sp. HY285]|uniref:hypothetical protein n=1 Tax=Gordonia liuliyuniae TaxID=2911517 RepID=UPI001F20DA4E|nr:hypothetical protein [Gordonia liuliyuniae]MCF8610038.1 hypothetical protein [Gordonia liuliyuniae]